MGRHLLLDADVLVHQAAFAAQRTSYHYKGSTFDNADECKTHCELNDLDYRQLRKDEKITTSVQVLPESACHMILKQKLDRITTACGSDHYTLFLSGDGNYREEYAKTKPYKGNRNQPKPEHYLFVRQLILENKRTVCAVGVEADDTMGITMTEQPESVICTIDKDLAQVGGHLYNWDTGVKCRVSRVDGTWFLLKQLLTGDATDNIPGIPGLGDKRAEVLLRPFRQDVRAAWREVQQEYAKGPFTFKDGSCTVGTPSEYLAEQLILLWLQRYPEQRITPKELTEWVNGC